jgi:hypothetical protein
MITIQYNVQKSYRNSKTTVYRFEPPPRDDDPFDDDRPEDDLPDEDLPDDREGADRPAELRPIVDELRVPEDRDPLPSFPMEDDPFRDGLEFVPEDFFIAGVLAVPELRLVAVEPCFVGRLVGFRSIELPVDLRVGV